MKEVKIGRQLTALVHPRAVTKIFFSRAGWKRFQADLSCSCTAKTRDFVAIEAW